MKYQLTEMPTALGMAFQQDLPFEEWEEIGKRFGETTKRLSWALGDWLVYGGSKFRKKVSTDMFIEAEKVTGVDRQSLLNFATVCRRIPIEKRVPGLTFEHHRAIASINNEERRESWLRFVSTCEKVPSRKLLKLSIDCSPESPKLITKEDYESKNRKFAKDNYVPHLRGLISCLLKTAGDMDDFQVEALKADCKPLLKILDAL